MIGSQGMRSCDQVEKELTIVVMSQRLSSLT